MTKSPKKAKAPHSPHRLVVVNPSGRGKVKTRIRRVKQASPPSYQPDGSQPGSDADGGPSGPNSNGW
jgi:hypothetical protein